MGQLEQPSFLCKQHQPQGQRVPSGHNLGEKGRQLESLEGPKNSHPEPQLQGSVEGSGGEGTREGLRNGPAGAGGCTTCSPSPGCLVLAPLPLPVPS